MKTLTLKRVLAAAAFAASFAGALPLHAEEMYYNRLSTGDVVVPNGYYGDIVLPPGGYKGKAFPSRVDIATSQADGDWGGSFAGIMQQDDKLTLVKSHTVSGWFSQGVSTGGTMLFAPVAYKKPNYCGYKAALSADGRLQVGRINSNYGWLETPVSSTEALPIGKWFYFTLAVEPVPGEATSLTVKAFVNGEPLAMGTGTMPAEMTCGGGKCSFFRLGSGVQCAGLRVDDATVTDKATILSWATDARYVVRNHGTISMPYYTMGYDPLDAGSGTFLTLKDQLAFKGLTLADLDGLDIIGTFTGGSATGANVDRGVRLARNRETYAPDGVPQKTVCSVNTASAGYAKGIVLSLTAQADGVHVQVPEGGARSKERKYLPAGQDPLDTDFADLDPATGEVTLKETQQTFSTSDTVKDYALRGLTATRMLSTNQTVLAFENVTVDGIKNFAFEGCSIGSTIARGKMVGYNAAVTETNALGRAVGLRVEMQMVDNGYVKCVVIEFSDGAGGVHVRSVAARYVSAKAETVGYRFVRDDGTLGGAEWTLANFYAGAGFTENGYGVFALSATSRANTATWTGGAGDGDPTNPGNWLCIDAQDERTELPDATMTVAIEGKVNLTTTAEKTFVAKSVTVGNATLVADCDWTYLPLAPTFAEDAALDVNGHALTVAGGLAGKGTVTSSAANGVLVANLQANWENTTVGMTGADLTFRKAGAGNYVNGLATSAGVCEIVDGTVKLGNAALAKAVFVGNGATLDVNGKNGTDFRLVLRDGATLANMGAGIDAVRAQLKQGIELEEGATAYLVANGSFCAVGGSYAPIGLALNGGTLVKRGDKEFDFANVTVRGPGKVQVAEGALGFGLALKGFATEGDPTVEILAGGQLKVMDNVALPALVGTGAVVADQAGRTLAVTNACGPVAFAEPCPTLALGDGATLDLSAVPGCYDATNFTFGATANLKLGERTFAQGEQVVAWKAAPQTAFAWDAEQPPAVAAKGIFYGADPESTEVARAYWTGAAGDGDATNPANWACTNLAGRVVTGGKPGATSTVVLTGAVDFYLPADKPLTCAAVEVADGFLVADCDWRGLGGVPFAGGTFIDLNGHTLKLAGAAGLATVTNALEGADNVGWLVFDIAADATVENGGIAVQGNVLVVKDGDGTFVALRAGQTYSAGTCVRAGVLRLGGNEDANHFLGADGSPLTVEADGTFDINGGYGMCVHPVTLAGGTLCNDGSGQTAYDIRSGFGNVTLTADSRAVTGSQILFSDTGAMDLGGHTLTVGRKTDEGEALFSLDDSYKVFNGTLACGEGVRFHTRTEKVDLSGVSLSVNFAWNRLKGIAVKDYECNFASTAAPAFVTTATVTGRFKTDGRFDNVVLADGATLDLGGLDGTLATTSAVAKCSLSFADGAAVKVDLGGRSTAQFEKLVSWTAKPNATFALADGQAGTLVMRDDGLWYRTGLLLFIR